jgi:hypothetical protein
MAFQSFDFEARLPAMAVTNAHHRCWHGAACAYYASPKQLAIDDLYCLLMTE